MSYKNKIIILFLLELIRSIIGFPDFIAFISLCFALTLIENKNILYAYYFSLFL